MSNDSRRPPYRLRTFWDDFDSLAVLPRPRLAVLSLLLLMPLAFGIAALGALWLGVEGAGLLAQVLPHGALSGRVLGLATLPSWERVVSIVLAAFPMIILARVSVEVPAIARWIGGAHRETLPETRRPD